MDFDEVADELYGLRPGEFTGVRDERARQARSEGSRELAARIRGLRRPTLPAWAANVLVRERQDEVAPLLQLGEELRNAHRDLDGDELRELSHRQHQLVDALARQAAQLASDAGQPLSAQAQQEVAQTLQAVMSDPDAARDWAAGRLTRPLTVPVGFDAAAREAAGRTSGRGRKSGVERPSGTRPPSGAGQKARNDGGRPERTGRGSQRSERDEQARDAEEQARRKAREAAERAEELQQAAEAAQEEAEAARTSRREAQEDAGRLRDELREAERAHSESRKREREAERREREAVRRAADAQKRARKLAENAPSGGRGGGRARSGGKRGG